VALPGLQDAQPPQSRRRFATPPCRVPLPHLSIGTGLRLRARTAHGRAHGHVHKRRFPEELPPALTSRGEGCRAGRDAVAACRAGPLGRVFAMARERGRRKIVVRWALVWSRGGYRPQNHCGLPRARPLGTAQRRTDRVPGPAGAALDGIAEELALDGWRRRAMLWSVRTGADARHYLLLAEFAILGGANARSWRRSDGLRPARGRRRQDVRPCAMTKVPRPLAEAAAEGADRVR
jgi:hypothetical protein